MDKLDYLILAELLRNAQLSFLKIAQKLGVSSFTVKSRYSKMKRKGIIKESIITLDLSKLGYQGKVFLLITNRPDQAKSVTIEALKKIRNIIVVSEIIGPFDILAIAPIIDLNSIKTLVYEVKKIPSVQRVKINCLNNTMFPVNPTFGKILSQLSQNKAELETQNKKRKESLFT
jgi:Lrp/AsnC family transcriptional regulator for asnA, asnC and gidA